MSKSTALAKNVSDVKQLFESRKGEITAALPKHMDADRMLRIAVTSIRKNPKLAEADPASLYGAVMEAAQCGLYLDGVLGEASLLPFFNNKKKIYEVVFIPGYRGLVKLAHRSNKVRDISSHIVYKGETFSYSEGAETKLKHTPKPPDEREEKRVGAYSRVTFKDGSVSLNWMWADEIIAIRDSSPSARKKTGPWFGSEFEQGEMWKKTVFRNHSKWLDLSPELTTAAVLDEMHDAGVSQRLLGPDEEVYTDDPVIAMPEPVSDTEAVEVVIEGNPEIEEFSLEGGSEEVFALEVSIRERGEALGMKAGEIAKEVKKCSDDVSALKALCARYGDELESANGDKK